MINWVIKMSDDALKLGLFCILSCMDEDNVTGIPYDLKKLFCRLGDELGLSDVEHEDILDEYKKELGL